MSIFNSIKSKKLGLNKFDLSHEVKMSGNMGKLYPILLQEVIPGDRYRLNSQLMGRMAPMVSPVMHRVNVFTHYFFVPNRLVWNEWEDFITGGEDGASEPDFPFLSANSTTLKGFEPKQLPDYFGIPPGTNFGGGTNRISALPLRGYALIYNEYFRDQNLEDKLEFEITSGSSNDDWVNLTTVQDRPWEKDYFTSALPWSQRGGEAQVPVDFEYKGTSRAIDSGQYPAASGAGDLTVTSDDGKLASSGAIGGVIIDNISGDTNITINDLRKASRLQEWLEASARGGSRYVEVIKNFFGVTSKDARLQRPEFLGGGRTPMIISEVLQTSATNTNEGAVDASVQGTMAGHGVSVGHNHGFTRSFTEHGYIIGLMSVLPKTAYMNGIDRTWLKFDKFDFYWKQFANLGEQEIQNQELYCDWQSTIDENQATWAYQQRYAEYKHKKSTVHGDFRTDLKYWHMARDFDALPALSSEFIHSDPRFDIFAIKDATVDHLYFQIYHSFSALRPMPYHSIPTL